MVKVSVIVPVFNVERYLGRCLDSLLRQTYKNIEVIAVDDCSADNSRQIAEDYAEKYPDRIKLVLRPENGRLSAARNSGIEKACGDYLTFVDSDDWVEDDYIEKLVKEAAETGADITACGYKHVFENGKEEKIDTFGVLTTQSSHREKVALLRNHACTRLYKTQFFKAGGCPFPEHIERAAELGTTVPLLTKTEKISILNEPLYCYFQRQGSNSLSNTRRRNINYMYQVFELIHQRCEPGFEKEIEYREIMEFIYGVTSVMIKCGYSCSEVRECLKDFSEKHPLWRRNPYLAQCPKGKNIYICAAGRQQAWLLFLMVKGYQALRRIREHK